MVARRKRPMNVCNCPSIFQGIMWFLTIWYEAEHFYTFVEKIVLAEHMIMERTLWWRNFHKNIQQNIRSYREHQNVPHEVTPDYMQYMMGIAKKPLPSHSALYRKRYPKHSMSVVIDLQEVLDKFQFYRENFPNGRSAEPLILNKKLPSNENLHKLAVHSLHHNNTLACYFAYPQIFLDIASRWASLPETYEGEFYQNFPEIPRRSAGSLVFLALARVLPVAGEITSLVEEMAAECDVHSDESGLLALYRLFHNNKHRFRHLVCPQKLHQVLLDENSSFVARMLAIRILASYLSSSEKALNRMIQAHIPDHDSGVWGDFDGNDRIDFRFLPLVEARRVVNFHRLRQDQDVQKDQGESLYEIPPTAFSEKVVSVCGVLLPAAKEAISQNHHFVATTHSIESLRQLALNMQKDAPTLLYGQAGSGKTFLINHIAKSLGYHDSVVKIHLGDQTDAKLLLGTYTSGEKPGTFEWRSGVLTTAVREGKWVLVEDIDKAPTEVLSILLTLLEKRELSIPSRGEVVRAHSGFQLISTVRTSPESSSSQKRVPDLIGLRSWSLVEVHLPSDAELKAILSAKYPLLSNLIVRFITMYERVLHIYAMPLFVSLNKGSHPRVISTRDLMKFCSRCDTMLRNRGVTSLLLLLESQIYDNIFAEAVDCFGSAITEPSALTPLVHAIGEVLEIPPSRLTLYLESHVPQMYVDDNRVEIGRAVLHRSGSDKRLSGSRSTFARTKHSKRVMEQIGVAIDMTEPVLLVGETGTGKTTVVQEVAKMMNKNITVINVSQQTEAGDLLGGYKPVNAKTVAVPLQEAFEKLFLATFSAKKNAKFSSLLEKCFNKSQWKNVVKLWNEAVKMANGILTKNDSDDSEGEKDGGGAKKKRRLRSSEKSALLNKWMDFQNDVRKFESQARELEKSFVFNFVEGSLVKAVRNGEWLLLDEINLASPDTLESIADLLSEDSDQRSILLSERGDVEAIRAHPEFRIFGCMNPSTDIGKRDLPMSIRSRFSEIYVHSPDRDREDLLSIIDKYIDQYAVGDDWVADDIAELYMEAKKMSQENKIVDGANQKPHFSIRTLTRTLVYVRDIVTIYGLRRSLYEGFCMAFLTLLGVKSEKLLRPVIEQYTVGKLKNPKSVMSQIPKAPQNPDQYVQFKHYWLKRGPEEVCPQPNYIITPFVEKNLLNLVRATASRRFPVLVQGPTSAGKTSMISYLAGISGHKFVRINNHEHTDLQEYMGTYVSDSTGKLVFREGVLVEALRKGYWIVLDELNLAPTDVLEALNRLLDDNRELFIPETQEVVRPHPDFMLFATQNPPGLYGGRKVLSRAFRNRFLELHFDDIPQDELEVILKDRCQIAPSYAKRIVEVYRQLSVQRQSTRLFEQKNSFATLRDLFRWALREAVGYEELAANGYMLLAERVRNDEERRVVKETLERVMRVKLDMDHYYEKMENQQLLEMESPIVWTKAMRRLAVLVEASIRNNEPLLLVGETGCGKTTICQVLASLMDKQLISVNAHQNTETGDILGAQRPIRNRFETRSELLKSLVAFFDAVDVEFDLEHSEVSDSIALFHKCVNRLSDDDREEKAELISLVESNIKNSKALFEWTDGPLVQAMKSGDFFLLDEISLADDSVLERLNSVLEPERSLLLAEKGTEDAFLVAKAGFQFLATMNPGGDYGKKELSPALRNRFTEIWVPSMDDFNDVKQIVKSRLKQSARHLTLPLVDFSEWFGRRLGNGNINSGVISLRDILAWTEFINSCQDDAVDDISAFYHGASMVFIDALGTNNTAFLAENEARLLLYKRECIDKLSAFLRADLSEPQREAAHPTVVVESDTFRAGPFGIPSKSGNSESSFNLDAPTTAANAMRVVRAMQVKKPVLLEGSPGVGKTSLVSAIAKSSGNNLIRINLSEQTDLIDLFGSDAPVEGGETGEFVWRDAPFLRAMKNGEWVLLDEMNLASQSVLEGLNACLDHRGEAYIPELDRSFPKHAEFKVFAAQNPQYQGGGRKGLPKSFINRFLVVYVDMLKSEDLTLITHKLFPEISESDCSKLIGFIGDLEKEVVVEKKWGTSGGPWEFNLRDVLRWLSVFSSKHNFTSSDDLNLGDFLNMIVCQRFRLAEDRAHVRQLYERTFGVDFAKNAYFNIGLDFVQAGGALIARSDVYQHDNSIEHRNLVPLQCNYEVLESAIRSTNENIPLIVTGPSNAGKTEFIRFLANSTGAKLQEFAMNSDVDSMDILGGYEQVDPVRAISEVTQNTHKILQKLVISNLLASETNDVTLQKAIELVHFIETHNPATEMLSEFTSLFEDFLALYSDDELHLVHQDLRIAWKKANESSGVRFEWFDGLLVKAVMRGDWLILDNANLCNPSVLDRLNSLLETGGSLIINECSMEDGLPRVLEPHPNFRLFLTVNPRYGELSRAMRNRCIEVFLEDLDDRATVSDKSTLAGLSMTSYVTECVHRPLAVLHDAMDFCEDEYSQTMAVNAVIGGLTLGTITDLEAWVETASQSSEMDFSTRKILSDLAEVVQRLTQSGFIHNVEQKYPEITKYFVESQTINPVFNEYIVAHYASRGSINWKDSLFIGQVAFSIFEGSVVMTALEKMALNGSVATLSYLEKSAAVCLGREVKNPPRLPIYEYIRGVQVFINACFTGFASQFDINADSSIFFGLFELHQIWLCLVNTARNQNMSKLRVYFNMVKSWVEAFENNPELQRLAEAHLSVLDEGLQLTRGASIHLLWEAFREVYPGDAESWKFYVEMVAILAEFDDVAAKYKMDHTELAVLRRNMLELYNVVEQGASHDQLTQLFLSLREGINKVKQIVEGQPQKHNEFETEFTMLSNFLDLDCHTEGKLVKQLTLYNYSNRPTLCLVEASKTGVFRPYPRIFDSLWIDGEFGVSGVFKDKLFSSITAKSEKLLNCSGNVLDQNLSDLSVLGKNMVDISGAVLSSQIDKFRELLLLWISRILEAHGISLVLPTNLDLAVVESTLNSIKEIEDDGVKDILTNYLAAALFALASESSTFALGKAYVLFAVGSIQLFVPNKPVDPAIEEHVIFDVFERQQETVKNIVNSWRSLFAVSSEPNGCKTALDDLEQTQSLEKPKVYRPESGFDGLFEEWNAFYESALTPNVVDVLMEAALDVTKEQNRNRIHVFHKNSENFMFRLRASHLVYADINDILIGYIDLLKLGLDLLVAHSDNLVADVKMSLLWPMDVLAITRPESLSTMFTEIRKLSKMLGANALSEEMMVFFIRLCFAQKSRVNDSSMNDAIDQAFQSLYYRWYYRKAKGEEQAAQEASLYKYEDLDDAEREFKELFPDYEDVMDIDSTKTARNGGDDFSSVYYTLCKVYMDFYHGDKQSELKELVQQGANLSTRLQNLECLFMEEETRPSLMSAVLCRMAYVSETFTSGDDKDIDFYHDGSPTEFKKAMTTVKSVKTNVDKLLAQWPEHATLQNISRTCDEFLNFPSSFPVSRLLQKIEVIFTYISEWEKFASLQVTLRSCYNDLTGVIVSWRRLELQSWKALFKFEELSFEKRIGKWWFHLFETIVIPVVNGDDYSPTQLLAALNIFMSETTYGEFFTRLDLVKAFRNHLSGLSAEHWIVPVLSNFIQFYQQFAPVIEQAVAATKKTLEKEVSEVILLASWKDVNIDALKQSSRKSHNNLYKVVKRYRNLLSTPVSPLVQNGVQDTPVSKEGTFRTIIPFTATHDLQMKMLKLCGTVESWNSRPQRLKQMSMVENNLKVFINRVAESTYPSLYEYAKEILGEMERLKNETPSVFNDETKKVVAALRNQKHKLLSETLKELRRIGIKTTVKAEIKKNLATVNLVLANSSHFSADVLSGCDAHFFRILDLLPRLRAAISSGNDEIPQPDLERGLAALENLTYALVSSREPLSKFAESLDSLHDITACLTQAGHFMENDKITLQRASIVESLVANIGGMRNFAHQFSKILSFVVGCCENAASLVGVIDHVVFVEGANRLAHFKKDISEPYSLYSTVEVSLVTDFAFWLESFCKEVLMWRNEHKTLGFLADVVLQWVQNWTYKPFINSNTSMKELKTLDVLEKEIQKLCNSILVSVQKVVELFREEINSDDDLWVSLSQQRFMKAIKLLRTQHIFNLLQLVRSVCLGIEHNETTSEVALALIASNVPLVTLYEEFAQAILQKAKTQYVEMSKSAFILSSALHNLATGGFCSPEPPSEEKQDDNLQEGTGLGDGEGATNNSKDADEDDDLEEHAQQPNEEQKEKDEGDQDEEDDAVEIEGDMAGDLEDVLDKEDDEEQEGEDDEQDLDEEVDDNDDDEGAVDEKMWDEEAQEDKKEKEADKDEGKQDEMQAGDDNEEKQDKDNGDDENDEKKDDDKEGEEDDEEGDNEDVGEQEDEVRNEEQEQMDENVPETDTLDLPENMDLNDDEDEDEENANDGVDDLEDEAGPEEEEEGDEMDVDEQEATNEPDGANNEEGEEEEAGEEPEDVDNGNGEDVGEDQEDGEKPQDNGEESEEEGVENKDEEKGSGEQGEEAAEGIDGAEDVPQQENEDEEEMDAVAQSSAGKQGEGAENNVAEEQEDIGASGAAELPQQEQEYQQNNKQDDTNEEMKESLKQLGDSLKEFHRRRQEIHEAAPEKEEESEQKANTNPEEFQHVEGENTENDTQALGAADKKEQVQSIDEDKALDEEEDEQMDVEEKREGEEANEEDDGEVKKEEEDKMEVDEKEDVDGDDFNGKTKGGVVGERKTLQEEDDGMLAKSEFDQETQAEQELEAFKQEDYELGRQDEPAMDLNEAREVWKQSEMATQELSSGLCEQLRLILEPTLATKLRGDYKTGKRLNMKRIIPYIASDFRKDKIWLRRTKPSKRQYQIMIAVDDSKSMSESKLTELAFHSITLVSKALTQLESGGLSIVRFGEDVKLVHPFDQPFSQETGAKIFQWFDFKQERTDIKQLCSRSLKIFENARASSNADLWQLQIIISDGVCEDHETIQRLVRKAREEKVMLVFVIIDGISSNESILDMSQVSYVPDAKTGGMSLKVDKYLDSFPFEFYVVVRNISELPEMLSLILRQYFSEVANV